MRKNCARKWLHLVIDLLPVLILPIFAIWEINHKENESISVEVANKQVVDFNQKIGSSLYRSTYSSNGLTITNDNEGVIVNGTNTNNIRYQWFLTNTLSLESSHIYYFKPVFTGNSHSGMVCWSALTYPSNNRNYLTLPLRTSGYKFSTFYLQNEGVSYSYDFTLSIECFDLTQMYGAGNEPSMSDFDNEYTNLYYPYVNSNKQLITNGTIVYDNTDIGSQMLYAVYKPVQQYFNFDNIFNFGALRNWFELNFFNGNMGIPMIIIWNIIIYEFLSDVIMLIYAFFMFIIDFANDLLEKPFSDIKRG